MSDITNEVEAWSKQYRPIKNLIDPHAGWDGELFETYGEEWEFVRHMDSAKVWTWVDGDGGSFLLNGVHWVNRIGYLITEVPYTGIDSCEVQVEVYDD